jgi:uncharacterized repeat protein (TIGR04076 family)
MSQCKITVIKTSFNKELVDLYVEKERKKTLSTCEAFKEGQEFITDAVSGMPQGFCPWAWDDIYKVLVAYYANGNFGMWNEGGNTIIACCTDGTRPVYFKIDRITA